LMKETQKPASQPITVNGMLPWLSAIPFGIAFSLTLQQLGALKGFGSIADIAPWLGGVLGLLAAYLIVHRGALFGGKRSSASLLLWLTFFPTLLMLYLVLNWLPTLVAAKGFPEEASLASVWFNLAAVAGAIGLGALVDRFGIRWPLSLSFFGLIGALVALGSATSLWPILILSGLVGVLMLGANYALYGAAASYYPPDMRGRGSGASIAWGRLGSVAGPLVGGFLLQGGASPDQVVYAMIPFAVVSGLGILALTLFAKPED